jgi:hypothetical protein
MVQWLILLCVLIFTGCGTGLNVEGYDGDVTPKNTIDFKGAYAVVLAKSTNTSDVKVYVVHSGTFFRLGLATGLATTRLDLHQSDLDDGRLTLAIQPMASDERLLINTVDVREHQIVHLDIESLLSTSNAVVWHNGQ